jgi:hypothetical protein
MPYAPKLEPQEYINQYGDYRINNECGAVGGMRIGRGNRRKSAANATSCSTNLTWPGIEPQRLRSEAGDLPPKLWQGPVFALPECSSVFPFLRRSPVIASWPISDVGRCVIIRNLPDLMRSKLSILPRLPEIQTYRGIFFRKVAYTRRDVLWSMEQIKLFTRQP